MMNEKSVGKRKEQGNLNDAAEGRTIFIRKLHTETTDAELKTHFEKFGRVLFTSVVKDRNNGRSRGSAFVKFSKKSVADVVVAQAKANPKQFELAGRVPAICLASVKKEKSADGEPTKGEEKETEDGCTLFVKNLNAATEEEDLQTFFEEFGQVLFVKILKDRETNSSRGIAFVKFTEKSAVDDILMQADEEPKQFELNDRLLSLSVACAQRKSESKVGKSQEELKDAEEGRTIFIRNLNFDTKEEDLKEFFEEFGEVLLAKIVKDRTTGRSRGTAFVKFIEKSATDDVLLQADGDPQQFELDGRVMNLCLALSRADVPRAEMKPLNEGRDKKVGKRNLHLSRVGVILPGSKEAEGLSKAELEKRLVIEKTRVEKLKDPNTFVSPVRLCVRNLPTSVDDRKLKKIFLKAGGTDCRIMEARIMRDLNRVNGQGVAKSRGFGFVAFDEHSHALDALMKVNNSPDIFGADKRPVVEFSIESRSALEKKARRVQSSQQKRKMTESEETGNEEGGKSAKRRRKSDFLQTQLQAAPNKLKLPNAVPTLKVKQRKKNKQKTAVTTKKPKGKVSRKTSRLKRKASV